MRAVIQRVKKAEVRVGGRVLGSVGAGLLVLLGIGKEDTLEAAESLADKIFTLRIFDDDKGRMNRSISETGGGLI